MLRMSKSLIFIIGFSILTVLSSSSEGQISQGMLHSAPSVMSAPTYQQYGVADQLSCSSCTGQASSCSSCSGGTPSSSSCSSCSGGESCGSCATKKKHSCGCLGGKKGPGCGLDLIPVEVPCLKPVTSCCNNLGRLGIPPLTTPLRADTPPIGKAVGRPLFGRWNGY